MTDERSRELAARVHALEEALAEVRRAIRTPNTSLAAVRVHIAPPADKPRPADSVA
jgi:hypothetical protein